MSRIWIAAVTSMEPETEYPIILFDGVCNLCETSVRFVIRNDRTGHFRFASLQSAAAHELLSSARYEHDALSSVLLLIDRKLYRKSTAALQICRRLDGGWPVLYYLFAWVPTAVADRLYDYIGSRRYQWFGRKDACWIPTPELIARFIAAPPDTSSGHSGPHRAGQP